MKRRDPDLGTWGLTRGDLLVVRQETKLSNPSLKSWEVVPVSTPLVVEEVYPRKGNRDPSHDRTVTVISPTGRRYSVMEIHITTGDIEVVSTSAGFNHGMIK